MASKKKTVPVLKQFEIVRGKCPSAADLAASLVYSNKGLTVEFTVWDPAFPGWEVEIQMTCQVVSMGHKRPGEVSNWKISLVQIGRRADIKRFLTGEIDTYLRKGFLTEALSDFDESD